jgi:DNA-binding CsgD family transcriptional regulator
MLERGRLRFSRPDPWQEAADVAARPCEPGAWQRELAQAIAAAARPDAAGVYLATLGSLVGADGAVEPRAETVAAEWLVNALLPRMHGAGVESPWAALAPAEPAACGGFGGVVGHFLRSKEGMLAGWIVVFTRAPADERLRAIGAPLAQTCRAAETTVRGALAMAAALGARFPRVAPTSLSEREMEVASLAANGFSDLNIAARLQISEGTVGRHLHNIYRKLGIGSRMQLSDLLCVAA